MWYWVVTLPLGVTGLWQLVVEVPSLRHRLVFDIRYRVNDTEMLVWQYALVLLLAYFCRVVLVCRNYILVVDTSMILAAGLMASCEKVVQQPREKVAFRWMLRHRFPNAMEMDLLLLPVTMRLLV